MAIRRVRPAKVPRAGTTRLTPSRPQVCGATGRPVAEQPAYTRREIDYPATVSSLVVSGMQFGDLKRRELLTLLGGAAAAWPLAARAQQAAMPVIGFLNGASPEKDEPFVNAFLQGLKETGYTENQNVIIEYRWADGQYARFPEMVRDFIRRQVAVIAVNTPAARIAKQAATNIPIVFLTGEDPVTSGLVTSLSRPGGNSTGVTTMLGGLAAKQFGLLRELVPSSGAVAFLVNPQNPIAEPNVRDAKEAAQILGLQLRVLNASTEAEIDLAFEALGQGLAGALLVQPDAFLTNRRIVALAARHAMPTMYQVRDLTAAGGLISYGPSIADLYRQMGVYTGKVLKGIHPAELPVLQPTRFELIVNLKTAKALGLTIPDKLLALADEVIE
jgi:putative ABC transport system substrate-binding protein